MSATATPPACCPADSLPPSLHETPHCGAVLRTHDGMRVYVSASDPASTPSDARAQAERALALAHRVIVVFTDVYGMDAARHKRFADDLASAIGGNTVAIVPDLFRENPIMQPWFPEYLPVWFGTKLLGAVPMLYRLKFIFDEAQVIEREIKGVLLPWLDNVTGAARPALSCVGFCYGGWVVGRALAALPNRFRCGVGIHPSFNVAVAHGSTEVEVAEGIGEMPLLLLPAGNDSATIKPGGDACRILAKARGVRDEDVSRPFEEMTHGWVSRGDSRDEGIAKEQARALEMAAEFLRTHTDK
jgi:dienelactone hydrolase